MTETKYIGQNASAIRYSGLYIILSLIYSLLICSFVTFSDIRSVEAIVLTRKNAVPGDGCFFVRFKQPGMPAITFNRGDSITIEGQDGRYFRPFAIGSVQFFDSKSKFQICPEKVNGSSLADKGEEYIETEVELEIKKPPASILSRIWNKFF